MNRCGAFCLAAAVVVAVAAVGPPLDRLADQSFAWHMLQHLLLLFVVAPLALLARPFTWIAALAGKRGAAAIVRAARPLDRLASPAAGIVLYIALLWGTHFSQLYELALDHPLVHLGEHALYVAVGICFWLPAIGPPPLRPLPFPARLFMLFVALPQGALVAAALDSARAPLYAHYAALLGTSAALADQRNGAAVMWIGGGMAIFAALLIVLGVWASRETRMAHAAEASR